MRHHSKVGLRMALRLSLGEPRLLRFGLIFLLDFNPLPPNPAKTQRRDPNDVEGNIDGIRGRRVARDGSVNRRISWVGSHPIPPTKLLMTNDFFTASVCRNPIGTDRRESRKGWPAGARNEKLAS